MNRWTEICELLEQNKPFCFIKMNDGETSIMMGCDTPASRGYQDYNDLLKTKLLEAFNYTDENYYVGLPCEHCHPTHRNFCLGLKHFENPYLANLLINSNFEKTRELLERILPHRKVTIIVNQNADTTKLPFQPMQILRVPEKNGWDFYDIMKNLYHLVNDGNVVLFMCGPLGRVLAYEWYKMKKTITCVELGSFYDYLTIGKAYMYHTDILPLCSVCNPHFRNEELDVSECNYIERYYFSPEQTFDFYPNPLNAKKAFKIYSKIEKSSEYKYLYDWAYYRNKFKVDGVNMEELVQTCNYFLETYPHRLEALFEFSDILTSNERVKIRSKLIDIPIPKNGFFINRVIYDWRLLDSLVIDYYYLNKYKESYYFWKILMEKGDVYNDDQIKERCIDNGRYAKFMLDEKEDSFDLFKNQIDKIEYPNSIDSTIPKIFHFIYIHGCHPFTMTHYIAIKSCFLVNKPDKIYFYCDRDHELNKWLELTKQYVEFVVVKPPTFINDKEIPFTQHRADLMRIYILYKAGGVYMDIDILSLNPLDGSIVKPIGEAPLLSDNLFERDFVITRECLDPPKLCNCMIMTKPQHKFIKEWINQYETNYGTDKLCRWAGLSVQKPAEIMNSRNWENVAILNHKSIFPFFFNDWRFFQGDISDELKDSLTIHLWDTEAFKYNLIPMDETYFDKNENTYTKLFRKYIL